MSRSLKLKPEDEAGIDQMVESGRYSSREAVVSEGLRLVREREDWLAMVEAKVDEGRAEIARGEGLTLDEVFEPLRERYRNWPR
ncbi:type II toxin-antitoxin system ParD family antitoxin [Sphingomonas sp. SUN019]|uniref:type II toxin-antitoxin system ParD family antitoxin n=1 Tax=Sphingomonas sp. SUN019 TaxID=2937788 RepID=UPI0021644E72|nr:type II toxin-antitoxin system ParD family antitoxin [Sphingomonas sp. SUN019]UVO50078.1 type II toxin-antitoxin system ParD family antitoxin [Sphingomonas sp. SUN019]